jgi:hypothetical protein
VEYKAVDSKSIVWSTILERQISAIAISCSSIGKWEIAYETTISQITLKREFR